MISKNLYLNIIIRVILVVVFSLLLGYVIFVSRSVRLSLIVLFIIVILTTGMITYLNSTNRRIRYFFDSVKNDDSNLTFPVNANQKSFRELYRSMTRVNDQIQQLKIEIRQQEQYFQLLTEQIDTGIITYNKKGVILHANTCAKKLLNAEALTHLKQLARIDEKLLQVVSNIKPSETRLIAIKTERGEFQLSLKSTSFKTKHDELIILSIQDIKNELDEKELESWMKLIRVLMHEIMNSITPITSISESLSGIYLPNENMVQPEQLTHDAIRTTVQGLKVMKEQGRGLMTFVESYRKLTRVPDPVRVKFKVPDLLSRVQVLYNSFENSEKVPLSVSVINPGLELFADQNLISQVLINLLRNALEANLNNSEGRISMKASANIDNITDICVIDNGPGINEELLDKIFVPFFTTRKTGSGIGLSISKQIMRMHGGTISVISIPGKETVFCLSFRG
ncbi:MAG TPA: ATP-binding protein [Bacteroidales bacterium]|nr:ATP-binding protein [Bacteroidales bacterium]